MWFINFAVGFVLGAMGMFLIVTSAFSILNKETGGKVKELLNDYLWAHRKDRW